MHEFIAKHQDKVAGTLSGFDRLDSWIKDLKQEYFNI